MEMLLDLENRIKQFVEVNELYLGKSAKEDKTIHDQNATYSDILSLIKQLKKNGEIYRGNEYVPDPIEPMVTKNKWVRKVIKEEL